MTAPDYELIARILERHAAMYRGRSGAYSMESCAEQAAALRAAAQPSAPVDVVGLCKEASEVLAAVVASGVPLPDNWRWPLVDELAGIAALAQQPPRTLLHRVDK